MKIKTGDKIIVITGKDRTKTGKVIKVIPARPTVQSGGPNADRLVVEGINLRKRRERPRSAGKPGQVIESPAPFAASKAMLWCPDCGRGRRIGHQLIGGKKLRVCRRCGHEFK